MGTARESSSSTSNSNSEEDERSSGDNESQRRGSDSNRNSDSDSNSNSDSDSDSNSDNGNEESAGHSNNDEDANRKSDDEECEVDVVDDDDVSDNKSGNKDCKIDIDGNDQAKDDGNNDDEGNSNSGSGSDSDSDSSDSDSDGNLSDNRGGNASTKSEEHREMEDDEEMVDIGGDEDVDIGDFEAATTKDLDMNKDETDLEKGGNNHSDESKKSGGDEDVDIGDFEAVITKDLDMNIDETDLEKVGNNNSDESKKNGGDEDVDIGDFEAAITKDLDMNKDETDLEKGGNNHSDEPKKNENGDDSEEIEDWLNDIENEIDQEEDEADNVLDENISPSYYDPVFRQVYHTVEELVDNSGYVTPSARPKKPKMPMASKKKPSNDSIKIEPYVAPKSEAKKRKQNLLDTRHATKKQKMQQENSQTPQNSEKTFMIKNLKINEADDSKIQKAEGILKGAPMKSQTQPGETQHVAQKASKEQMKQESNQTHKLAVVETIPKGASEQYSSVTKPVQAKIHLIDPDAKKSRQEQNEAGSKVMNSTSDPVTEPCKAKRPLAFVHKPSQEQKKPPNKFKTSSKFKPGSDEGKVPKQPEDKVHRPSQEQKKFTSSESEPGLGQEKVKHLPPLRPKSAKVLLQKDDKKKSEEGLGVSNSMKGAKDKEPPQKQSTDSTKVTLEKDDKKKSEKTASHPAQGLDLSSSLRAAKQPTHKQSMASTKDEVQGGVPDHTSKEADGSVPMEVNNAVAQQQKKMARTTVTIDRENKKVRKEKSSTQQGGLQISTTQEHHHTQEDKNNKESSHKGEISVNTSKEGETRKNLREDISIRNRIDRREEPSIQQVPDQTAKEADGPSPMEVDNAVAQQQKKMARITVTIDKESKKVRKEKPSTQQGGLQISTTQEHHQTQEDKNNKESSHKGENSVTTSKEGEIRKYLRDDIPIRNRIDRREESCIQQVPDQTAKEADGPSSMEVDNAVAQQQKKMARITVTIDKESKKVRKEKPSTQQGGLQISTTQKHHHTQENKNNKESSHKGEISVNTSKEREIKKNLREDTSIRNGIDRREEPSIQEVPDQTAKETDGPAPMEVNNAVAQQQKNMRRTTVTIDKESKKLRKERPSIQQGGLQISTNQEHHHTQDDKNNKETSHKGEISVNTSKAGEIRKNLIDDISIRNRIDGREESSIQQGRLQISNTCYTQKDKNDKDSSREEGEIIVSLSEEGEINVNLNEEEINSLTVEKRNENDGINIRDTHQAQPSHQTSTFKSGQEMKAEPSKTNKEQPLDDGHKRYQKDVPQQWEPPHNLKMFKEYVRLYDERYNCYNILRKTLKQIIDEFKELKEKVVDAKHTNCKDQLKQLTQATRKRHAEVGKTYLPRKKAYMVLHKELDNLKDHISIFYEAHCKAIPQRMSIDV